MTDTSPRIGFVGLGNQGTPIAERILAAGFPLAVWARRPAGAAILSEAGATVAPDLPALAASSDILCICVLDDAGVIDVADGVLPHMAPGGTIAILSTAHPHTCQALADRSAAHGIALIDAPVSGGAAGARAGTMTVMLGGDPAACERVTAVLQSFASTIVRLGDIGAGQTVKLINNTLLAANLAAANDAVALGQRLGLDAAETLRVLAASSGRSFATDILAGLPSLGAFANGAALLDKDVALLAQLDDGAAAGPLVAGARRFIAQVAADTVPTKGS